MFALMVNGGEVTSLKGVFSTREQLDPIMAEILRDCGCTEDEGYVMSTPVKSMEDHRKTYVHVFEGEETEDWSVLFTIIELAVDVQLDIEI